MVKVYWYSELSDNSKKKAVSKVWEIETDTRDWHFESKEITENLEYIIEESGLNYGRIYWENNYGPSVNLKSLSMTEDFMRKSLDDENFKKYKDIDELSGEYLTHYLFDDNFTQNYALSFHHRQLTAKEAISFLLRNVTNDEESSSYKFLHLLIDDLNEEQSSNLVQKAFDKAEEIAQEIEDIISAKIESLEDKLKEYISKQNDYYESEDYIKDLLDDENSYENEVYLFNENGDVIAINGEVKDEFIEEFGEEISKEEAA